MINYRINRSRVEEHLIKLQMNFADLARKMKVSRSMINYIVTSGGKKYAKPLAKALRCNQEELIKVRRDYVTKTKI